MGNDKPRILVVDDEQDNIAYLRRALGRKYEVHSATNGEDALELIKTRQFDVIIADHRMPGLTGVQLLERVLELSPETVRIILTGYAELDATIDAINLAHVSAFIRKPVRASELDGAVSSAVEIHRLRAKNEALTRALRDRTRQLEERERFLELSLDEKSKELWHLNQQLAELVVRDGLTGLYNHRYFQERAEEETASAKRYGHPLSMVFFDIDDFKIYNDKNGHPRGDDALKTIARLLVAGVRKTDVIARTAPEHHIALTRSSDIVARYGGEEFVALLPHTSIGGAVVMAERILRAVENEAFVGEDLMPSHKLTMSAGVAGIPAHADNRAALIDCADQALYRAKSLGRNRVCIYDE